jgi:5-formyltetrahydrofolate cyclo-ligase
MAVPPTSPKAKLRSDLKDKRQRFVSSCQKLSVDALLEAIAVRVMDQFNPMSCVAVYRAIGSEVDPEPIVRRLHAQGTALSLPHVTRFQGSLRFLAWAPGDTLEATSMGLQQPVAETREVTPDVILTPLLGFDGQLNRIGYGAGHYDAAFARFPRARRIGLAWSIQRCTAVPTDPWDIPLHAVATENEWIVP